MYENCEFMDGKGRIFKLANMEILFIGNFL